MDGNYWKPNDSGKFKSDVCHRESVVIKVQLSLEKLGQTVTTKHGCKVVRNTQWKTKSIARADFGS